LGPAPAPETIPPPELEQAFIDDPGLKMLYEKFAPYKKREFCEAISEAKRTDTKKRRLQKVTEHIRAGRGLSDKYR